MPDGPSNGAPRALCIRHDPDAHPGHVGRRLAERGFAVDELPIVRSYDRPDVEVDFGAPTDWDLIVPLGSVFSVYDEAAIGSWIRPELAFLAEAQDRRVPVLGICFGAQALAAALGGAVERTARAEVGWHDIESDKPDVVASGPWMQWHYDRFTVPTGATELARSPAGPQAFTVGRSLAVQFHPEVTETIVSGWLESAPAEELTRPGVDPAAIRADTAANHEAAGQACDRMVDWFLDSVAELG